MNNIDCTLLIMARDASLNQCEVATIFIDKFWPDCCMKKVVCTQTKTISRDFFDEVIYVDPDLIWGDRLAEALKRISTKYVILLAEDMFLRSRFQNERLIECVEFCEKNNGVALRLDYPVFFTKDYNKDFYIIPKNAVYRTCLQPTLFKTEYLKNFTYQHYSPWQFERNGSLLSSSLEGNIFAVKKAVFDSVEAWSRGMWYKEAYNLMVENNIPPELYEGKKIFPFHLEVKGKFFLMLIRLFPHIITRIQMKRSEKGEKKLKF